MNTNNKRIKIQYLIIKLELFILRNNNINFYMKLKKLEKLKYSNLNNLSSLIQ